MAEFTVDNDKYLISSKPEIIHNLLQKLSGDPLLFNKVFSSDKDLTFRRYRS